MLEPGDNLCLQPLEGIGKSTEKVRRHNSRYGEIKMARIPITSLMGNLPRRLQLRRERIGEIYCFIMSVEHSEALDHAPVQFVVAASFCDWPRRGGDGRLWLSPG